MDLSKLEERVNAANQRINKAAELQELFDLLEKKFIEQEDTINAITQLLESVLDNIDNTPVLDDARQRVERIIQNHGKEGLADATRLIENKKVSFAVNSETSYPRPVAGSSPWYDADKG